MSKIIIVTAMWKRPDVFALFVKGIHNLMQCSSPPTVICVGSEGHHSQRAAQSAGFIYIEHPNQPLSDKHNRGVMEARKHAPTHLLMMGSDDIISPELYELYCKKADEGVDFMGMTDLYFYDLPTRRSSYWGGYIDKRKGATAGAGRMISSRMLNRWEWMPFERRHSHILDDSIQQKLAWKAHSKYIFSLKDLGMYAVDIKSEVNMTPFELWPNTRYLNNQETNQLKTQFPYL